MSQSSPESRRKAISSKKSRPTPRARLRCLKRRTRFTKLRSLSSPVGSPKEQKTILRKTPVSVTIKTTFPFTPSRPLLLPSISRPTERLSLFPVSTKSSFTKQMAPEASPGLWDSPSASSPSAFHPMANASPSPGAYPAVWAKSKSGMLRRKNSLSLRPSLSIPFTAQPGRPMAPRFPSAVPTIPCAPSIQKPANKSSFRAVTTTGFLTPLSIRKAITSFPSAVT